MIDSECSYNKTTQGNIFILNNATTKNDSLIINNNEDIIDKDNQIHIDSLVSLTKTNIDLDSKYVSLKSNKTKLTKYDNTQTVNTKEHNTDNNNNTLKKVSKNQRQRQNVVSIRENINHRKDNSKKSNFKTRVLSRKLVNRSTSINDCDKMSLEANNNSKSMKNIFIFNFYVNTTFFPIKFT